MELNSRLTSISGIPVNFTANQVLQQVKMRQILLGNKGNKLVIDGTLTETKILKAEYFHERILSPLGNLDSRLIEPKTMHIDFHLYRE